MPATIEPWLAVPDATRALQFYEAAFGAEVGERVESEPGTVEVARLAIAGAGFWIARDPDASPVAGRGPAVRLIVVAEVPDALFARALAAGATEIAAMHDAHGWHVGRLVDPFGHAWEVGARLTR